MSNRTDWLPSTRAAQLEMAKRWLPHVNLQKAYWKISNEDIRRLTDKIDDTDQAHLDFQTNPSPGNRAQLREAYRELVAVMRYYKTRIFLTCSKVLRTFELGVLQAFPSGKRKTP